MKTAANAPSSCMTTPMFGINTASTSVNKNQTMVVNIRLRFSVSTICSGDILQAAVHRQSKAALNKTGWS